MFKKGSKLYAMFLAKCPRCHEGNLYENRNAYVFKDLTKMSGKCEQCGENFLKEPGYYFGAAYVSYALTVALWVAVFVAMITFDYWGWIEYSFVDHPVKFLISGVVTLVLLLPILYRLSRAIWINIFVHYDSNAIKNNKEN